MEILAVDDERLALESLCAVLRKACPDGHIVSFQDSERSRDYVQKNHVDVAFLDVDMPVLNGLELARRIKEMQPRANIVFVTAYSEYAVDAFAMRASGYLLKPVTAKSVTSELNYLREPLRELRMEALRELGGSGIYVQTFGSFEVFCKDQPVQFGRGKAKELLAYLVDRKGAGCTTAHLCAVLWEDKDYDFSLQRQFQTIVSDLLKTLRTLDAEDIIVKRRNFLSVDVARLNCDYYRFLRGDTLAVNAYSGEYMSNYSWAEFTTGFLNFSRNI